MVSAPFAGISVLERAGFIAGPYCAKLLGDLGARVVKIEPPGAGDSARGFGPFPGDVPDRDQSGLFLYLATNKRSVTLDSALPAGRDLFTRLAATADVLVEDSCPGTAKPLGLDYATLQQANPRLVYVSITPYGQDGPRSQWKAHHMNTFHAAGEGYTMPGGIGYTKFPDRAPITGGAHVGEYDAGLMAALATVAALFAREVWGLGQQVDISKQEATMALNRLTLANYFGIGQLNDRSRNYEYGGIYACKNGYVNVYPREDHQWRALAEVMGRPELAEQKRFLTRGDRIEHGAEANQIIREWTATLNKDEIYHRLASKSCPASPFATSEDVFNSPQLASRGFFAEVDHPKAGTLRYPSQPYQFSSCPRPADSPAPLLGQHNEEILCGELGLTGKELTALRRGGVI
ncbi:MAG: CoA transferase [Dehalococcoidia bacterium]|nr:CoA transferase [Dehalococcoidia bacterium]